MVKKADLETERPPSPMLGASQGGPRGMLLFLTGFCWDKLGRQEQRSRFGGLRAGDGCRGKSTSGLCSFIPGQAAPLLVPERGRNRLIWCLCGELSSSARRSRRRVVAQWGRPEGVQAQTRPLPPAGCKHKLTSLCHPRVGDRSHRPCLATTVPSPVLPHRTHGLLRSRRCQLVLWGAETLQHHQSLAWG